MYLPEELGISFLGFFSFRYYCFFQRCKDNHYNIFIDWTFDEQNLKMIKNLHIQKFSRMIQKITNSLRIVESQQLFFEIQS